MSELESLESALRSMLGRLGLGDLELQRAIRTEWEGLAGDPWRKRSRPLVVRNGELVVEASDPALVGLLRYAVGELMRRLDLRFGSGAIASVRVQAPPPPSRG
jgi:hypothetical protein